MNLLICFMGAITVSFNVVAMEIEDRAVIARGRDEETRFAIEYLKNTPPSKIATAVKKMPPELLSSLFSIFTGGEIEDIYKSAYYEPDILTATGRILEKEAREHERQYVKDCPGLKCNQPTTHVRRVRLDSQLWRPGIFGTFFREYGRFVAQKESKTNPGQIMVRANKYYVVDELKFSEHSKGIQVISQNIERVTSEVPFYNNGPFELPIYNKIVLYCSAQLCIEVGTHNGIDEIKELHYGLENAKESHSFGEALGHFLAYEIKKENIRIFQEVYYDDKLLPRLGPTVPKLRELSGKLSYSDNLFFHTLLQHASSLNRDQSSTADYMTPEEWSKLETLSKDAKKVVQKLGLTVPTTFVPGKSKQINPICVIS